VKRSGQRESSMEGEDATRRGMRRRRGQSISSKVDGYEKFSFSETVTGKMDGEERKYFPEWRTSKARSAPLTAFSGQRLLPYSM